MMMNKMILLLSIGVWLGLLIGLSFIEAPLKFQAPNVTIELGLGIGQLVFRALNKMEIILSLIFILAGFKYYLSNRVVLILTSALVAIVMYQSIWLLPALDQRVEMILDGQQLAKSYHHYLFIILEVSKVTMLPILFHRVYNLSIS